jgi:hypothetical protein
VLVARQVCRGEGALQGGAVWVRCPWLERQMEMAACVWGRKVEKERAQAEGQDGVHSARGGAVPRRGEDADL